MAASLTGHRSGPLSLELAVLSQDVGLPLMGGPTDLACTLSSRLLRDPVVGVDDTICASRSVSSLLDSGVSLGVDCLLLALDKVLSSSG